MKEGQQEYKLGAIQRISKKIFARHFLRDMRRSSGVSIGADIACAHGKNRRLFHTVQYVGVDRSFESLRNARQTECGACYVCADLRALPFHDDSIEFLVSTHSIDHLPPEERFRTICVLAKMVKKEGILLFNVGDRRGELEAAVEKHLEKDFSFEKVIRYKNFLTSVMEDVYRNGSVSCSTLREGTTTERLITFTLFLVEWAERMTSALGFGRMLYLVAIRRSV